MTRRLTIAIVGVVAGALLLAGLGTLGLVTLASRQDTRRDLERQAATLSEGLRAVDVGAAPLPARAQVVRLARRLLTLQDVTVVRFGPGGNTIDPLPAGVSADDLRLDELRAGTVVSGNHGGLAFAAAPVDNRSAALTVVVLTRSAETGVRSGWRWFLLAAAVVLLAAVVIAVTLGSRLTKPVRDAEAAARRIAAGDLSARVPEPSGEDELVQLARSVNAMAAELERARGMERQFLLSVSHDLRTPLTSIQGFAEAIAEGAAPDHEKAAAVISAEARRLERLVRDLLDLARLEARRFSLDVRDADVAEIVTDTAEGFRPAAADARVELALRVDPAVRGAVDPDRLAQVVANLVENALKFAASRIEVGARAADGGAANGGAVLWVGDDGPGIAPEDLPRVFERLYTAGRSATRQGAGSGLGLAIVRELVEAMGGTVRAESPVAGAATGGTRVVVSLPAWS